MKIGIITIFDNDNYGNRLQNYATQETLKRLNAEVETIVCGQKKVKRNINIKNFFPKAMRKLIRIINKLRPITKMRKKIFENFTDTYIKHTNFKITPYEIKQNLNNDYDYFVAGSDQIWNPKWGLTKVELLAFAESKKRIAFSASIGAKDIPKENQQILIDEIKKFKSVSVREERAKEIIEELTGRKDIQTLVDPTMLLTAEEWDKISKKPNKLKTEKYILTYFLGNISKERKKEIKRVAKENNCKIINILDKNGRFYTMGPSEFLYLEKNAFLICTDSFHSCIFAILYQRPFLIFERENTTSDMTSRLDTLLETFKLKDRKFTGKINNEMLKCDYTESYKVLEKERKKADEFIKKALKI